MLSFIVTTLTKGPKEISEFSRSIFGEAFDRFSPPLWPRRR